MELTAHLHLVPRLNMSGAKLLLHLYAFMAYTEANLFLPVLWTFIKKIHALSEMTYFFTYYNTVGIWK